jgi:hypothetical protein
MTDPITLRLQVASVQDMHVDDTGAVQRVATLIAVAPPITVPSPLLSFSDEQLAKIPGGAEAAEAERAAIAAQKATPDPNAVLGVPGVPQISFTLNVREPSLLDQFLLNKAFTVTLASEGP